MSQHDDSDEARLFRDAIGANRGEVRPLPATTAPPAAVRPSPTAKMAARDEHLAREEFLQLATATTFAAVGRGWRRDGVPSGLLDRLARGEFAVQAEFCPNPRSFEPRQRQLAGFLRDCRSRALGCVRIVLPGPSLGHDPAAGPTSPIERALEKRADVVAYHASTTSGGGLVLTVLLRGQRR